jgi:hypothetical protein
MVKTAGISEISGNQEQREAVHYVSDDTIKPIRERRIVCLSLIGFLLAEMVTLWRIPHRTR